MAHPSLASLPFFFFFFLLLLLLPALLFNPIISASPLRRHIARSRPLLLRTNAAQPYTSSVPGANHDSKIELWGGLNYTGTGDGGSNRENDDDDLRLVLPSNDLYKVDNYTSSYYGDDGDESSSSSSSSCEPTYGFLPCTDTILGNLFLLLVYGYLLFLAAQLLSEGSELLLTVLDAGIIGGLLLPILGALPDAILILVSGLGGTQAEAQEQVLVGMGLLAGSIVMLLTLLWGSCLLLGRCDFKELEDGKLSTIDRTLTKPYDLTNTGVENDDLTQLSARIMILSIVPFVVAQLPSIFNFSATGNIPVLVACVLALAGLVSYCLYQVFTPWIQERRKEIAQKMIIKAGVMSHLLKRVDRASLINEHGVLDEQIAEKLFKTIDINNDGRVEKKELQFMLQVTFVEGKENDVAQMVDHIMKEYDVDNDDQITHAEFLDGLRKWCKDLNLHRQPSIGESVAEAKSFLGELEKLKEEEDEEESDKIPPTKFQIVRKAVILLIAGTLLAAVFADPLVDAVSEFSTASHIPSFFISFVLLPLASNSSEAVSSILFSARKKKRNMSLTYSQSSIAAFIPKESATVRISLNRFDKRAPKPVWPKRFNGPLSTPLYVGFHSVT